jgi:hypothetical protein
LIRRRALALAASAPRRRARVFVLGRRRWRHHCPRSIWKLEGACFRFLRRAPECEQRQKAREVSSGSECDGYVNGNHNEMTGKYIEIIHQYQYMSTLRRVRPPLHAALAQQIGEQLGLRRDLWQDVRSAKAACVAAGRGKWMGKCQRHTRVRRKRIKKLICPEKVERKTLQMKTLSKRNVHANYNQLRQTQHCNASVAFWVGASAIETRRQHGRDQN